MLNKWFQSGAGSGLLLVVSLALCGCVSVPSVVPPNLPGPEDEERIRRFDGVTPQQVLVAAETVLRKHQPEGRITFEKDAVVMDYKYNFFYGVTAGYELERWVLVVRQQGELAVASVAMSKATDGYVMGLATSGKRYPREGVQIDYGMFWKRVQSVLRGSPWPECEKEKNRQAHIRYYEPMCM